MIKSCALAAFAAEIISSIVASGLPYFIFSAIGEEFGFFICGIIVTLYVVLLTKAIGVAKNAKDVAAGAVFVMSMFSVCIGIIIFLPKIIEMFR